jgi:hypothetical protein
MTSGLTALGRKSLRCTEYSTTILNRTMIANSRGLVVIKIKAKRRERNPRLLYKIGVCIMTAVVIKTELEVPDNRLCNALTPM